MLLNFSETWLSQQTGLRKYQAKVNAIVSSDVVAGKAIFFR